MTIPDLCIRPPDGGAIKPMLKLGRYLYLGFYSVDARWVWCKIESGELGEPQLERCQLLLAIKEEMEFRLVSGESINSIRSYLSMIAVFFQFLEKQQLSFRLDQLIENYILYSEHLFIETHKKPVTIKKSSAYGYCANLSCIFGSILNIPQAERLVARTRIKHPHQSKKAKGKNAEKQNLEDTFKMGHVLISLVEGITKDSVLGPMPLKIQMQEGLVPNDELIMRPSLPELEWLSKPTSEWTRYQKLIHKHVIQLRGPVDNIEGTRRWILVNLRVGAELLLFIAQTGMNLTQAINLERSTFKYKALGDSWEVSSYKKRRGGEVRFKIYKSYKAHLLQHQVFINYFFPDSKYLFPLFNGDGKESRARRPLYDGGALRRLIKKHNLPWVPPSKLRNTRINWLLRRSGDEDLTADLAQHTKEVLRDKYELPSQQRAMVEITQFWNKHDPIKQGELKGSLIGNSPCNGKPKGIDAKPDTVVDPNCVNPSGCLWCKNHRDRDKEDYVWSLTSLRYLKLIEAGVTITSDGVPADHIVDRLTEKIEWYRQSNGERKEWVTKSKQKIEEGDHHPDWAPIIEFLE